MAEKFQSSSVRFSGELELLRSWILVPCDLEASTGVLVTVLPTSFLDLSTLRSGRTAPVLMKPLEMEDLELLLDPKSLEESVLLWLRLSGAELG